MALTDKQAAFVAEYLIDLNATQAAIRAGYSAASAEVTGSRLLRNAKVAQEVAKAKGARAERVGITADRVLEELAKIGFANMADYTRVNSDGDPFIDLSKCGRDHMAAISEVSSEDVLEGRGEDARTIRKTKVKLHDKKGALVDIGKHLGMFKDQTEHTGTINVVFGDDPTA